MSYNGIGHIMSGSKRPEMRTKYTLMDKYLMLVNMLRGTILDYEEVNGEMLIGHSPFKRLVGFTESGDLYVLIDEHVIIRLELRSLSILTLDKLLSNAVDNCISIRFYEDYKIINYDKQYFNGYVSKESNVKMLRSTDPDSGLMTRMRHFVDDKNFEYAWNQKIKNIYLPKFL